MLKLFYTNRRCSIFYIPAECLSRFPVKCVPFPPVLDILFKPTRFHKSDAQLPFALNNLCRNIVDLDKLC